LHGNRPETEIPSLALAGIAFLAGFSIGARRMKALKNPTLRLIRDVGGFVVGCAVDSYEKTKSR